MVVKNDFSHENLAQQFKQRTISRIYYAACIGGPLKLTGRIEVTLLAIRWTGKFASRPKEQQDDVENVGYKLLAIDFDRVRLSYLRLKLKQEEPIDPCSSLRVGLSNIGMNSTEPTENKTFLAQRFEES